MIHRYTDKLMRTCLELMRTDRTLARQEELSRLS